MFFNLIYWGFRLNAIENASPCDNNFDTKIIKFSLKIRKQITRFEKNINAKKPNDILKFLKHSKVILDVIFRFFTDFLQVLRMFL